MSKGLLSRISWIDVCRGMGILLVLYGHAIVTESHRYIIYAFHMPLFFFLSGIVFKQNHEKSFFSVVLKNVRQILIPYAIFALLTFFLDLWLMPPSHYVYTAITKQLYGILYGNGNNGYLAFNVALWFLPCLFVSKIAFAFLTRITNNKKFIGAILLVCSIIGYVFSTYFPSMKLVFGLETAFTGIVFFGAGYLWYNTNTFKNFISNKKIRVILICTALTVLFATFNFTLYGHQIDMRLNRINNYFFFYVAAFSGILTCASISMLISKNVLLEYFGRHSLLLFVWHRIIFAYLAVHSFPPFAVNFLTPFIYIIMASGIILSIRLILERIKLLYLYSRTNP